MNSDFEKSNIIPFPLNRTKSKKDSCVRCGRPTPYDEFFPIDQRKFYVEGSGQLCVECWNLLYSDIDSDKTQLYTSIEHKKLIEDSPDE